MKLINSKAFYKAALRKYGGMIILPHTETPWGSISYPMKFIGVNLGGKFLFACNGCGSLILSGTNVYIRNGKPKQDSSGRNVNFLALSAHQRGLDFLEKIYQSQKPIRYEEIFSDTFHL